jgi:hypothetical protein
MGRLWITAGPGVHFAVVGQALPPADAERSLINGARDPPKERQTTRLPYNGCDAGLPLSERGALLILPIGGGLRYILAYEDSCFWSVHRDGVICLKPDVRRKQVR